MFGYRHLELRSRGSLALMRLLDRLLICDDGLEELAAEWNAVADSGGYKVLLMDFSHVEFLSSEMLAKLISLRRRLKRREVKLVLCGMRREVREVFRRTQLDRIFEIHERRAAGNGRLLALVRQGSVEHLEVSRNCTTAPGCSAVS
jgi:anti-sigma B factor antagonist